MWETATWTSSKWTVGGSAAQPSTPQALTPLPHPSAASLIGAEWSSDGRTLLLAHGQGLSTLHLTASPPSLSAQVLPVAAPELLPKEGAGGEATVHGVAWDPRGQRLALALGGRHPAAGCVALYDTRSDPILTARFVGFARVLPAGGQGRDSSAAAAEPDWEIVEAEEAEGPGAGGQHGGGVVEAMATAMTFLPAFEQGAVLAVRQGDCVSTLPMYFSV